MRRAAALVLALLLAPPAWAVPGAFSTQGRLLDADGSAVDGSLDITFRLLDDETEGSTLWSERQSVVFTNGYYSVVLGADEEGNPLSDAVLDQWPLWLEVQIDGQPPMSPRTSMGSVPYARLAGRAEELIGGTVDADTLAVGGVEVVDASGAWVGAPIAADWADLVGVPAGFADGVDADLLGDLACADGQALVFAAASGWTCADPAALLGAADADISVLRADLDAVALTCDSNTAAIGTLGGRIAVLESGALVLSSSLSALEGRVDALEALDAADTLSALSCLDGDVAKWDDVLSAWVCADDLDTRLTEAEVDAMVADNGFAADADLRAVDGRVSGLTGRVTSLEGTTATQGSLLAALSGAVTTLGTRLAAAEALMSTLFSTAFSGSFLDLSDVPAGLEDGDDDTLAGLACADGEVAQWSASAGEWLCTAELGASVSESDVERWITDGPIDLAPGTTIDGVSLGGSGSPSCTLRSTGGGSVSLACGSTVVSLSVAPEYTRLIAANDNASAYQQDHYWCAIDSSGRVRCNSSHWGETADQELSDAAVFDGSRSARHMTLGICGVTRAGAVLCSDALGQSTPVAGADYVALAGTADNGCAMRSTGEVSCWGAATLSTATYVSLSGSQYQVCGIRSTGTLECIDFRGTSTRSVVLTGSWTWVDARSESIFCAGQSTGATYCHNYSTTFPIPGTWLNFTGRTSAASTSGVYGCGVLSSGTMRCVDLAGVGYDFPGRWRDAIWIRGGDIPTVLPFVMVAVSESGEIFDPGR